MLMKFEATVKVINPLKEGMSQATGNPYKYQSIVLEAPDGEHTARWLASLGTRQVEVFQQLGIKPGMKVIVDLTFTTHINSSYVDNRIYVNEIALADVLPKPEYPQYPQAGTNY